MGTSSEKRGSNGNRRPIAFFLGLPKGARIAAIAVAAVIALSGLAALGFAIFSPPAIVTVIHPFGGGAWKAALDAEAASYAASHSKSRVRFEAADYAEIHDRVRTASDWDIALGSTAILGMEDRFAEPAVPITGSIWGVYYNKAAVKSAGLSESVLRGEYSLADLEAALKKAKEAGKTPIALGSRFIWPLAVWIQAIMAESSVDDAAALPDAAFDPASPAFSAAVKKFQTWVDAGYVNVDHSSKDWPSSIRAVIAGDAAFCLFNEEFISSLLPAERARIGYLPLPGSVKDGKTAWAIGSLVYVARARKSAHALAARAVLKDLMSPAAANRLSATLSAPFFASGSGPSRILPSISSSTMHPSMEAIKKALMR